MRSVLRLRIAAVAAALTLGCIALPAAAQVQEIEGVEVEATGASGTEAREAARKAARIKAVEELYRRSGLAVPESIDPATAEAATVFMDVASEKVSGGTYRATLTVGLDINALGPDIATAAAQAAAMGSMGGTPGVTVEGAGWPGAQMGVAPTAAPLPGAPDWILLMPAHVGVYAQTEFGREDGWVQSWLGTPAAGALKLAATPADEQDRQALAARNVSLAGEQELQSIAAKYGAPAAALAVLEVQTEASADAPAYGTLFLRYWSPATGFRETQRTVSGSDLTAVAREAAVAGLQEIVIGSDPAAPAMAQAYSAAGDAWPSAYAPGAGYAPDAAAMAPAADPAADAYNPSAPDYALPQRYSGTTAPQPAPAPGMARFAGSAVGGTANAWPTPAPQMPGYGNASPYGSAAAAGSAATTVPFSFAIDSIDRWIGVRREIEAIPGASVTPLRLSRTRVDVMIRFTGDEATLRRQLAARGLVVE